MTARAPSPLSTGGAGTVFEQHVGAMFLALLLTRGIPAIFRDCQVEEVGFQTRRLGWETDDLLVTCSSRSGPRRLAMQSRRSFTVGKSDGCKETIQKFWNDFNADRFNPDRDALVLATLHRTGNLGGLASLLDCARSSPGPADFKDRLETPGFVSDAARGCHQHIRSVVDNADSGSASDEMIWRFLRTVYVLFLDFTTDTAQQEATVTQWLAQSSGDPDAVDAARATWHELVAVAADAAPRAKPLCHSDLPVGMRERYGAIPVPVLQPLVDHSTTILNGIHSTIGGETTLPRTEVTTEAAMALGDRVVALTGPPGSGKSALAKAVIGQHSDSHLCLSFRATEFAKSHIDDVLPGPISGERFRLFVGAQERVLVHVDGLERLLECPVRDAFGDLVDMAERCPNVSLVLTCRDTEMENAAAAFFGRSQLMCRRVKVPPLSADEMERVGREVPGLGDPLSRRELARIMSTPYVLDMAARMDWSDRQNFPSDTRAFQKKWWSETVRKDGETAGGMPDRRERTLVDLAVRRARELRPSVPTDGMDAEALDGLRKDGIVAVEDGGLAAPAHDVIEDRAVICWLESRATRHEWAAHSMAKDIGTHPAVRRGFREWLRERLDTDSAEADRFVLAAYDDGSLPRSFREDVLISVLLSGSVRDFVSRQKDRMLADDARLLVRMMHLTRVACTKAPGPSDGQPRREPALPEPEGEAWPVLLEVIDCNIERLLPGHYRQIRRLLERWANRAQSPTMPEGAVPAIRVAYRLLHIPSFRSDDTRRILEIIAGVPRADSGRFLGMVEQASSQSELRNIALGKFRDILMGRLGFPACRDFPKEMAGFVRSSCIPEEPDTDSTWTWHEKFSPEFKFGLYPHASSDYKHFSAFRGLFWPLLRLHPDVGIRLVLDLVNHAGDWYGTKGEDAVPRIVVSVPGHGGVMQWADDRLWQAYRGASEAPYVIACALMALEHWLLKRCEHGHDMEYMLSRILRESRNVMTAGVVASVCSAHPNLCGAVPLALLKSKDCISLDRSRVKKEGDTPLGRYAATSREDRYCDDERRKSNELPHRRRDLESLARKLRLPNPEGAPPDGEGADTGRTAAFDAGNTDEHLQDHGAPGAEDLRVDAPASLYDWGLKRWRRDPESGAETWQLALALARDGAEPYVESDRVYFTNNGPPVVAAVCVRDHWEEMSADERMWCAGALAAEVGRYSDDRDYGASVLSFSADSDSIAARSLPKILAGDPDNETILAAVARSLTHESPAVRLNSAKGVGEHLEPRHSSLVLRCAGAVAMLSNLLAGNGQRRPQEGRESIADRSGGGRDAPELARRALVDRSIDTEGELENLDLASRRGRDAAVSIMHMLGRAPDLPVTERFIARLGRAVVDTWTKEHETLGGPDQEFSRNAAGGLAEVILSLPRTMLDYCRPFLDAVDARPDRVASFIGSLATHMDGSSAGLPFWDVWRAFADRITKAPWAPGIVSNDSKGAELVRRMMFGTGWFEGPRRWECLAGHEERVGEFVGRLPPTPHVLASFAHYLYVSGAGSNPVPLKAVAGCLRAGDPAELLYNEYTVYSLAHVLQRYVYGRPATLKEDPTLRDDTLLILDRLVDAGSPAAYMMRDDFATPNVGK